MSNDYGFAMSENYNMAVTCMNDDSREDSKKARERALVYSNLAIADAIKEQTRVMRVSGTGRK